MAGYVLDYFKTSSTSVVDRELANDSDDSASEESGNFVVTPLEKVNPLGYSVGPFSVIILILQGVVGTGIFVTPSSVLKSMGSIGSTYVLWICCFFLQITKVFIYIEYAGYFPKRNGGDVAYLEQAYPNPKFLVPTMYAAISVILSYTTSSALAFGQYIIAAAHTESTTWVYRGIAVGVMTFSCVVVALSTKWSLRLQNLLGVVKIIFLFFMVIVGWVVLGGGTKVEDPHQSFRNVWEGTTTNGNNIANSIIKVVFSYGGAGYAFGVVAEHTRNDNKSEEENQKNLLKTYSLYVPLSLVVIFIVYILLITGYYAAASPEAIKTSKVGIATLFFQNVFGNKRATSALSSMIALSALGHLITAIVSHSRGLRECGRQGVLPFGTFWTSTKPFGTPLGPIFVTWLVNTIMIVAPPAGSAYNFIVDLGTYSSNIFNVFLILGLLKVRRDRRLRGLGKKGRYLPLPIVIIDLLFQVMVIAIAFVPPEGTLIGSDVSFFYATYPIVTIGLLVVCAGYYWLWRFAFPKMGQYIHRELIYRLENGEMGLTIVKVKLSELEEWDRVHSTNEHGIGHQITEEIETKSSQASLK